MFDSAPPNLPLEQPPSGQSPSDGAEATAPPPRISVAPQGAINQTGIKEPEDIFADIKEPQLEASVATIGPAPGRIPSSHGFPWKLVFGVGIPLVVVSLGLGGWYVYNSYRTATKVIRPSEQTPLTQANVPVTSVPDNTQPIPNPVPKPDEDKFAASQAAIKLMQAQAARADLTGEFATSNAPTMPTSTLGTGGGQAVATFTRAEPPTAPPNIPPPQGEKPPAALELKPGLDSDGDGLANSEELLLGINPNAIDSDADGYADGGEVKSGYDPAVKNAKLSGSQSLKVETIGAFEFLIPKTWERKAGAGGSVQIMTGTPAVMTINLQPYATQQKLLDWVMAQNEGITSRDFIPDKTISGADVIYSKDGMTAWILGGNTVYQLRYGTNGASAIDFGDIFKYVLVKQTRTSLP